jgi:hypothetical protein
MPLIKLASSTFGAFQKLGKDKVEEVKGVVGDITFDSVKNKILQVKKELDNQDAVKSKVMDRFKTELDEITRTAIDVMPMDPDFFAKLEKLGIKVNYKLFYDIRDQGWEYAEQHHDPKEIAIVREHWIYLCSNVFKSVYNKDHLDTLKDAQGAYDFIWGPDLEQSHYDRILDQESTVRNAGLLYVTIKRAFQEEIKKLKSILSMLVHALVEITRMVITCLMSAIQNKLNPTSWRKAILNTVLS